MGYTSILNDCTRGHESNGQVRVGKVTVGEAGCECFHTLTPHRLLRYNALEMKFIKTADSLQFMRIR